MATPYAGKYGRFQVNGTNANVEEWSGSMSIDIIDANGFEDQVTATGRLSEVVVSGIDRMSVSVRGYVDGDALPTSFGFFPGTALTNVKLYINKTLTAVLITLPAAVVSKVNVSTKIKDKIMFDLEIRSNGAFSSTI